MALTTTPLPASQRKHAVAAARGSVLALHAAAGLAISVCRDAERMLRASEGLARAAVACLERAHRPQGAPPGGAAVPGDTAPAKQEQTKKKNSRKRTKKDVAMDKVEPDKVQGKTNFATRAAPSGPSAPLSASAAEFSPIVDDGWADDLPRIIGPLPEPREPQRARSSSRSPRNAAVSAAAASTSTPSGVALEAGRIAAIRSLDSRPELNGQKVRLIERVAATGRWVCALGTGERVTILPGKLAGLHASFQDLAERQFLDQAS